MTNQFVHGTSTRKNMIECFIVRRLIVIMVFLYSQKYSSEIARETCKYGKILKYNQIEE